MYNYQELKEFVKNNPDKYLREIKQGVFEEKEQKASFGGIYKALKTLNIDLKKNLLYKERNEEKRTDFNK